MREKPSEFALFLSCCGLCSSAVHGRNVLSLFFVHPGADDGADYDFEQRNDGGYDEQPYRKQAQRIVAQVREKNRERPGGQSGANRRALSCAVAWPYRGI